MSAEAQSKGRYKLGEGITGKVIESGKPLVIPNVLVEPLFLNRTGEAAAAKRRFPSSACPSRWKAGSSARCPPTGCSRLPKRSKRTCAF